MAPFLPSEVSTSVPLGALLEFPPVSPSLPFQVSTSSNWTTSQFSPVTRSSSRTCGASTGQWIQPSRVTTAKERRTFSRWGTRRVGRAHNGFTSTPAESNLHHREANTGGTTTACWTATTLEKSTWASTTFPITWTQLSLCLLRDTTAGRRSTFSKVLAGT